MKVITSTVGSTGELFLFRWYKADGSEVARTTMDEANCSIGIEDEEGTAITSNGAFVVDAGAGSYSFGYTFGSTELTNSAELICQFTVQEDSGSPVLLEPFKLIVRKAVG